MTDVPNSLPGEEWRKAVGVNGVLVSNMCRCYREPTMVKKLGFDRKPALRQIPGGIVASKQIQVDGLVLTVRSLVATTWLGPRPYDNLRPLWRDGNPKHTHVRNLVWGVNNSNKEAGKIPSRCFDIDGRPLKLEQDRGGITR